MCAMAKQEKDQDQEQEQDSVDRHLAGWGEELPKVDMTVEGIVDRIHKVSHFIKRSMEQTLAEFDLSWGEWGVLGTLRRSGPPYRRSPGELAEHHELSTGAMTNRLDRLEEAGLVRRLPNPDDRRGILVELTDEGHRRWEASFDAQAEKEALMTRAALDEDEKRRLNDLLRRLALAYERNLPAKPKREKP
jgi:DNA-binding MarR family transcriptional regulator